MKTLNFKPLILTCILMILAFASVKAQNLQRPKDGFRPAQILRQLGLTKDQIQQIRRINRERQPKMREAHARLREANRALDRAIYADTLNEEEIQNRLSEVQLAQVEVIKLRNLTELQIRKVLTAEQIVKFRGLREEFERRMDERRLDNEEISPQERDDTPNQPINNRPFKQRRQSRQNF